MSIMAATNSQNNRSGSGRYTPLRKGGNSEKRTTHFDCSSIMDTLNSIDERNIRTTFKQAKDPIELAFNHISNQPLKKVATNAIKEGVADIQDGFEELKDSMGDIKESFGDLFSFIGKIFTTNEEFVPEAV